MRNAVLQMVSQKLAAKINDGTEKVDAQTGSGRHQQWHRNGALKAVVTNIMITNSTVWNLVLDFRFSILGFWALFRIPHHTDSFTTPICFRTSHEIAIELMVRKLSRLPTTCLVVRK